jgi:hypothetical protein
MKLQKAQLDGLGVALNEAILLGVEVDVVRSLCGITMSVLSLPDEGPAPPDSRLQILLSPIGRVSASLRHGRWDDKNAKTERFELSDLLEVVQSFGGLPVYGWEFFDLAQSKFEAWSDRLSLDWQADPTAVEHSITLFQEGYTPERTLDLKIWFRKISFHKPTGEEVAIEEVIKGGRRWWDGLHAGDPRTSGHGIVPCKP